MTNLKDFAKEEIKEGIKNEKQEESIKKAKDDYSDLIDLFLSKYGQMNEDELMQEMLKLIAEKKANGTFDSKKIKELAQSVAPMLTDEQRAKMYQLLNYLD